MKETKTTLAYTNVETGIASQRAVERKKHTSEKTGYAILWNKIRSCNGYNFEELFLNHLHEADGRVDSSSTPSAIETF